MDGVDELGLLVDSVLRLEDVASRTWDDVDDMRRSVWDQIWT